MTRPPLLRRWADPAWWRYVRYTYPERLIVCGGLVALALAFGGFLSVSALGGRGTPTSEASPRAQAPASQPGTTAAGRTTKTALPHSPGTSAYVADGGSATHHAASAAAPSGTSQARGGQPAAVGASSSSTHSAAASAPVGTTSSAGPSQGSTTPTATTPPVTTTAASTTTTPTGTTIGVTTPVVTVTVPLP